MGQTKVSIPPEEWQLVVDYYKKHEKHLKLKHGIRSPTALLRHWLRQSVKKIPHSDNE